MTLRIQSRRHLGAVGVLLVIAGCTPSSGTYRSYVQEEERPPGFRASWQQIELYAGSLQDIRPYVHVYPTGYHAEAPELDPRSFGLPERLVSGTGVGADRFVNAEGLGLPDRPFVVLGEVSVPAAVRTSGAGKSRVLHEPQPIEGQLAGNRRPYCWYDDAVDVGAFLDDLQRAAHEKGADALIEVFLGEGVEATWVPGTAVVPAYDVSGSLHMSYFYHQPAQLITGGWQIKGLAVRWVDEDDVEAAESSVDVSARGQ